MSNHLGIEVINFMWWVAIYTLCLGFIENNDKFRINTPKWSAPNKNWLVYTRTGYSMISRENRRRQHWIAWKNKEKEQKQKQKMCRSLIRAILARVLVFKTGRSGPNFNCRLLTMWKITNCLTTLNFIYSYLELIRLFRLSNDIKWADACYVNDILLLFYYHLKIIIKSIVILL